MNRKCKICKSPAKYITAANKGFCGDPECGLKLHKELQAKRKEAQAKKLRKETRTRKQELLTVSDWTKKVQVKFNAYIRERDKNEPCISCGRICVEDTPGGRWDCGHYLSRGAFPELRFEPLNAHKQCKSCNAGSSKYAKKDLTVSKEYRKRLIDKIGIEKVEWLEGPHPAKRYRVDDLKELYEYWKQKLKEEKERASHS